MSIIGSADLDKLHETIAKLTEDNQCIPLLQAEIERQNRDHVGAHRVSGLTIRHLEAEIERLRAGIHCYLSGDWMQKPPSKLDKCPHDHFGWEDCGACIDEYFVDLLGPEPSRDEQLLICEKCGTVTTTRECDCTKFGHEPRFVPFRDEQLGDGK